VGFVKRRKGSWLAIWGVGRISEGAEPDKYESMIERLKGFCIRLGGRVEKMRFPDEFGCKVNPASVIQLFPEFERLVKEAKDSGVERIYFGEHDAFFFAYPGMGEAGFTLTYDTEEIPEEKGAKFQKELESEFYSFMSSRNLAPEFDFIPRVEYGGDYVDVEARVPTETEEGFGILADIAKAMLEFKSKLHELMKKYNVRAKIYSQFL